ncbi:MAG: hypothetical protein IJU48_06815 [Synergistaceae bacterium]|nr:hypothetical protein [Synergistaceae bacterium]
MNEYQAALNIIRKLNDKNFEAFLVGGCVRNSLMNIKPDDYDIATNASVQELESLFDYRTIGSGEKHGTVLVLVDNIDFGLEVTTFRDGAQTLGDDLSHRDFTINAMAYHPSEGIIDYFGGTEDIKNKIIRGVENPRARFQEDPLRILRGLRFASVLGFEIEAETSQAIHKLAGLLSSVAPERLQKELTKIICGINAEKILLDYHDVVAVIIPEISPMVGFEQHNSHHYLDVFAHTLKVLAASKNSPVMRWTSLFHDIAKPECFFMGPDGQGHFYGHDLKSAEVADNIMERLRFDNKTRETIDFLVAKHCVSFPVSKKCVRRMIMKFGLENVKILREFQGYDLAGHVFKAEEWEKYNEAERLLHEVEDENNCMHLKDLAVNGHDMIALGLEGREIGRALNFLLEAVVDEKVMNEREELLRFLEEVFCYEQCN